MVLLVNVYVRVYIYMYVYENGCLLSEMLLSSAETSGKLTALVFVLKWLFLKHLMYGLVTFNQSQTQVKTSDSEKKNVV